MMNFSIFQQYIHKLEFTRLNYMDRDIHPEINVQLNIENHYNKKIPSNIVLHFDITSFFEDTKFYEIKLSYACIFSIDNMDEDDDVDMNEIFLSEIPTLLFPYIRHIISYVTRDGGFVPLVLQGINFNDFFDSVKDKNYYGLEQ